MAPALSAPKRSAPRHVQPDETSWPRNCAQATRAKLRMRARLFSNTLRPLVGVHGAAQLLHKGPYLLQRHPGRILASIKFITELTGIPEHKVLPLALRNTHVLLWDSGTLQDRWENLQAETGFSSDVMQSVVMKNPALLFYSPFSLRRKIRKLQGMLHCSQAQVMKAVKKHPHLLAIGTLTASVHLSSFAELLHITPEAACTIIRKQPSLLSYAPATLQSKLAFLSALLHLPPIPTATLAARHPSLLGRAPSSLLALLAHLQTLLDPSSPFPNPPPYPSQLHPTPPTSALPAAAAAAARCPTILTLSQTTLASRYLHLQHLLQLPSPPALAFLVLRVPPLLQLPPATLALKLASLQRTFSASPADALQMVCSQPTLLCLNSDTIDRKWRGLQGAVERHEGWKWQLALAPNKARALMVCRSLEGSLERMRVLAEAGLEDAVTVTTVVCSSKKQFEAMLRRRNAGSGQGGVGGCGGGLGSGE